jgi:hypothetical protein
LVVSMFSPYKSLTNFLMLETENVLVVSVLSLQDKKVCQ